MMSRRQQQSDGMSLGARVRAQPVPPTRGAGGVDTAAFAQPATRGVRFHGQTQFPTRGTVQDARRDFVQPARLTDFPPQRDALEPPAGDASVRAQPLAPTRGCAAVAAGVFAQPAIRGAWTQPAGHSPTAGWQRVSLDIVRLQAQYSHGAPDLKIQVLSALTGAELYAFAEMPPWSRVSHLQRKIQVASNGSVPMHQQGILIGGRRLDKDMLLLQAAAQQGYVQGDTLMVSLVRLDVEG